VDHRHSFETLKKQKYMTFI